MVGASENATSELTGRVVLLGASNLARGMRAVTDVAASVWGEPCDLLAALGHGRSYGTTSRVLGRSLPGIVECGLWPALSARPVLRTKALVTDIGNDLLYGASVTQIAGWVEQCLDRLAAIGAHVIVTGLPICNLAQLGEWRFRVFRTLLFPLARASLAQIVEQALQLDQRVAELARQRGCTFVEQSAKWFGLDPIHVRLALYEKFFQEIFFAGQSTVHSFPAASRSLGRALRLRLLAPEERRLLGVTQRCAQPCFRLPGGTRISLY